MKFKLETPRTVSVEEAEQMLARVKATELGRYLALLCRQEREEKHRAERSEHPWARNLEANVY